MRYPTIPKTVTIVRADRVIHYSWKQVMDEFFLQDRRWSKDPKFRETFNRTADPLAEAAEESVFPMESQDFENYCEVMQEWPPQGVQVIPDIVRPTRRMINQFCAAPTSDPRETVKVDNNKKSETGDQKE